MIGIHIVALVFLCGAIDPGGRRFHPTTGRNSLVLVSHPLAEKMPVGNRPGVCKAMVPFLGHCNYILSTYRCIWI